MMNYTREQLEDFMNNKPYGAFKKEMKSMKGSKSYTFEIKPYTQIYGEKQVITVRAKNEHEASRVAMNEARKNLPEGFEVTGWSYYKKRSV